MEDHRSKKGGPQGTGVAAKGDSSTNNELLRPSDDTSASLGPFPLPAPVTPPNIVANPGETISDVPRVVKPPSTDADPDVTISKTMAATVAEVSVVAVKTRLLAGQVFAEAGEVAKAQKVAADLTSEPQPEPQVYAKIIDATSVLMRCPPGHQGT